TSFYCEPFGLRQRAHEYILGPHCRRAPRCKRKYMPAWSNFGTTAGVSLVTNGVTAGSSRSYLEHYLDVLYRKPGALAGSKPLEQRRQAGLWPASFDRIWQALIERHSHALTA